MLNRRIGRWVKIAMRIGKIYGGTPERVWEEMMKDSDLGQRFAGAVSAGLKDVEQRKQDEKAKKKAEGKKRLKEKKAFMKKWEPRCTGFVSEELPKHIRAAVADGLHELFLDPLAREHEFPIEPLVEACRKVPGLEIEKRIGTFRGSDESPEEDVDNFYLSWEGLRPKCKVCRTPGCEGGCIDA